MSSGSPAVATPEVHATAAAEAAFARGGNAIDAALAAASTLAVTYPQTCASTLDQSHRLHEPGNAAAP